jgi:hypothetical protein
MKKIMFLSLLIALFSFSSSAIAGEREVALGVGFGGGAGGVKVAYNLPTPKFDLALDGGYGIGNNYGVATLGISAVMPIKEMFIGLGLGIANYSTAATDIIGLSGIVDQGTKFGVGIYARKDINKIEMLLGYNSALGLTAGLLYKF